MLDEIIVAYYVEWRDGTFKEVYVPAAVASPMVYVQSREPEAGSIASIEAREIFKGSSKAWTKTLIRDGLGSVISTGWKCGKKTVRSMNEVFEILERKQEAA